MPPEWKKTSAFIVFLKPLPLIMTTRLRRLLSPDTRRNHRKHHQRPTAKCNADKKFLDIEVKRLSFSTEGAIPGVMIIFRSERITAGPVISKGERWWP